MQRIALAFAVTFLLRVSETTASSRWTDNDGEEFRDSWLLREPTEHSARARRATTAGMIFVLRYSASGNLFTVASTPPDPTEGFLFISPVPAGLTLSAAGVVSKVSTAVWNVSSSTGGIMFSVSASKPNGISVTFPVQLIIRPDSDPLFSNQPQPMWTTCPIWIRPGTPIYTLTASDSAYGANVMYRLEAGGDGFFAVDSISGAVTIVGRQMFNVSQTYSLSVSARGVGVLPTVSTSTPSALLNIQVGPRAPQFYSQPFNITFTENMTGVIYVIQALSFQDLPLSYQMTSNAVATNNLFTINPSTGAITLTSPLVYLRDARQYFLTVTVNEQFTNFVTTTPLTINLLPSNHPPTFLVQYYVINGLAENAPAGTSVLNVMAYDYDPGLMGVITYTVSDSHFTVVPNTATGSGGIIQVGTQPLLYEFLNEHRFEFTVTATDSGTPPMSANASVQVYMINANNWAPKFEPVNQTVIIKESCAVGTVVHYIQAYDPDGDNINFQLDTGQTAQSTQSYFSVSSVGEVTLRSTVPRPTNAQTPDYVLYVNVTDDGSCCPGGQSTLHTTRGIVIIQVQRIDTQPVFQNCYGYTPSVPEGAPIGTIVLNMTATDNDSGDDGTIDFFIVNTNAGTASFGVNKTGDRTAQLFTSIVFNRESPPTGLANYRFNDTVKYPVTVKVQDRGRTPLSTNCFMLVTILDVNDNRPVFDDTNYQTVIMNVGAIGTSVMRVFAYDIDSGDNGRVSYSLSTASPPICLSSFSIDAVSGLISRSTAATLQTTITPLNCLIVANDNGVPQLQTTASVLITVTNNQANLLPVWGLVNCSLGFIAIDSCVYSVLENVPVSSSISLSLSATTPGRNANVGYYLTATQFDQLNGRQTFSLVDSTSSVVLSQQLDASLIWLYYLRLRAFVSDQH